MKWKVHRRGASFRSNLALLLATTMSSTATRVEAAPFDWSFTGVWTSGPEITETLSGSGEFTATNAGGDNYTVTGISGTISDPNFFNFKITGLDDEFGFPDQTFHLSSPQLNAAGIGLTGFYAHGAPASFDFFWHGGSSNGHTGFHDCGAAGYCLIMLPRPGTSVPWDDPDARLASLTTFAITPAPVSAVAEPSTWAMMLLGFAGRGVMAYRRKSVAALA